MRGSEDNRTYEQGCERIMGKRKEVNLSSKRRKGCRKEDTDS
jgi:hypothetical protein